MLSIELESIDRSSEREGGEGLQSSAKSMSSKCRVPPFPLGGRDLRERFEGWLGAIGIGEDAVASGSSQ